MEWPMSHELGSLHKSFNTARRMIARKRRKGDLWYVDMGKWEDINPESTDLQGRTPGLKTVQWPKVVISWKMPDMGWCGWSTAKQEKLPICLWTPNWQVISLLRSALAEMRLYIGWPCLTIESERVLPIITSGPQMWTEFAPGTMWVILQVMCIGIDWMFVSLLNSYVKS